MRVRATQPGFGTRAQAASYLGDAATLADVEQAARAAIGRLASQCGSIAQPWHSQLGRRIAAALLDAPEALQQAALRDCDHELTWSASAPPFVARLALTACCAPAPERSVDGFGNEVGKAGTIQLTLSDRVLDVSVDYWATALPTVAPAESLHLVSSRAHGDGFGGGEMPPRRHHVMLSCGSSGCPTSRIAERVRARAHYLCRDGRLGQGGCC